MPPKEIAPEAASGDIATAVEAAPPPKPPLPAAAQRALAEAEERRKAAVAADAARPKELGGREGPDPVRFGDWEKGGIASDF